MARFQKAAEECQAKFRSNSPTISDRGRSPTDPKGLERGWLLAHGYEEENLYPGLRGADGALKFFSERGIAWWQDNANGDITRGKAPTRQMKSSQVACVNFLLPLAKIPGALRAVLRAIDNDVEDVVLIPDLESPVELEWIGLDTSLEGVKTRGALSTSTDAFMVASTKSGTRRAYLIEWKYVEEYHANDYKGEGKEGKTRLDRYTDLYYSGTSSFNDTAPVKDLFYDPFYQLMRFRLLADRMVAKRELGVTDAKVIVVVPQGNIAYRERITSRPLAQKFPELKTVEAVVKATLKNPDGFKTVDYSTLIGSVERECGAAATDWVSYHRERYGSIDH